MKTIVIYISFIFLALPVFSQVTYEGSVNSKYKTVQLDDGNIRYFIFNRKTDELSFYNIDGTTWKKVKISLEQNEYFGEILLVSQKTINPDDLIEVAYTTETFKSFPPNGEDPEANLDAVKYTLYIINEDGNSLLSVPDSHTMKLLTSNRKNKLLIYKNSKHGFRNDGETLVYTLPENN